LAYLGSLSWIGALYILAVPAAVLVSFLFEPYERQYVFALVSETAMFAANVALLYLVAAKQSSYRKTNLDEAGLPH